MSRMSIEDRLASTKFDSADETPHIIINKKACGTCKHKACTTCCPAVRYQLNESNELLFDHVGCLECGNCRLVCDRLHNETQGYRWDYPVQGKGVIYRRG